MDYQASYKSVFLVYHFNYSFNDFFKKNLFLTFLVVILGLTCGQFTVFLSHTGKLSRGKVLGRASGQESCLKKGGLRDGPQAGGLSQGDGHRVVAPGYRLQL